MAQGRLGVYPGRLKKFPMTWRQGSSTSSPPIDCSNAVCSVISSNFPGNTKPSVTPVNVLLGQYELTFPVDLTRGLKSSDTYRIHVALTFNTAPGYSPDPVAVEVSIL